MMNGQIERIRDKSETDIFFEHRDRLPLKSVWYHLGMVQVQKLLLYAGEQLDVLSLQFIPPPKIKVEPSNRCFNGLFIRVCFSMFYLQ